MFFHFRNSDIGFNAMNRSAKAYPSKEQKYIKEKNTNNNKNSKIML